MADIFATSEGAPGPEKAWEQLKQLIFFICIFLVLLTAESSELQDTKLTVLLTMGQSLKVFKVFKYYSWIMTSVGFYISEKDLESNTFENRG